MAPLRTMSLILLVLVTMVVSTLKGCKAASIFPRKTRVRIINGLNHIQDLTLHCKSKTDDKGEHTLKPGDDYQFGFHPNPIMALTLYFCNFWWPSDTSSHYFDIYDQARDEHVCRNCSWKTWEQGECRYDDAWGSYIRCYAFQEKPLTPLVVAPSSATNSSGL